VTARAVALVTAQLTILFLASSSLPRGAASQQLRQLTRGPAWDHHPVFSPSGAEILFTSRAGDSTRLFLVPLVGGVPRPVPVRLTGDLYTDWAPDGRSIVFDAREGDGPPDIYRYWLASGEVERLTNHPGMDGHPSFSPTGARIAFTSTRGGSQSIWTMGADGGNPIRLTDGSAADWHPQWSPDGRSVLFTSNRGGDADIWVIRSDGTGLRRLTSRPGTEDRGSWSPDGSRVVFNFGDDLWVVDVRSGGLERLTDLPGREGNASWSPDGRSIAFVSDRAGTGDIWVLSLGR